MQWEVPSLSTTVISFPLLCFPESPWAQVCTAWNTQAHPAVTSVRPSGVCLPGDQEGESSHMWDCLSYLFMSASVSVQSCLVLFVFYLVLSLFILEAPGSTLQTWLRLHLVPPGKRAVELSPSSFGYGSESRRRHSPFSCQRVGGKYILFILKCLRRLCKDRGVML